MIKSTRKNNNKDRAATVTVSEPITNSNIMVNDISNSMANVTINHPIVQEPPKPLDKYQKLLDMNYSYSYSKKGEPLGEGAFSIVLQGTNKRITPNEDVAIKIISKKKLDEKQRRSVTREVVLLKRLQHCNIVKFVDFFEDSNYYYIIQELCGGGEIFNQIVNLTYFSEDLSRHVICQVAEAIKYLHNQSGVVHRDLKPENLLFDTIEFVPSKNPMGKLRKSDDANTKLDEGEFIYGVGGGYIGRVTLADFGLSKQIWEDKTKTPCGTVGYTAPEIVKDQRYSKEVDMWALGCVLYTLLCGFPPFYDEKIDELTEKIAKGQFEFLKPWWDEISIGAKNCVSRLLCVDKTHRYDINSFFQDPWIKEFLRKLPKDNKGNHIYTGFDARKARMKSLVNNSHFLPYSPSLASPAAIQMKDAFDVSSALHRQNAERGLKEQVRMSQLIPEEDEEEEEEEDYGYQFAPQHLNPVGIMDLNLAESSIMRRRKNDVQV